MARRVQVEQVASGVSIGSGAAWNSKVVEMNTLGPVQFVCRFSSISGGSATIYVRGLVTNTTPASDWVCSSRGSLSSGGAYFCAASPGVQVTSSAGGQPLPFVYGQVVNAGGVTSTFDAWLVYEVEE